jgi:hypothetical protein
LLNVLLFLSLFGQYTQTDRHTHTDPAISLTATLPLSSKELPECTIIVLATTAGSVAVIIMGCPKRKKRIPQSVFSLPEKTTEEIILFKNESRGEKQNGKYIF